MKLIVRVLTVLMVSCLLYAGGVGTTAVNFLRIGTGSKAAGMGEAQVAIADNVDSIFWNPAGLAHVANTEIGLMHLMYWQGINYENGAIALPIKKFGTLGIGIDYLNSGSIDRTTENAGFGSSYTINGTFSYVAFAGTIAYGNKIVFGRMPLNVGASIKIVGDKIDDDMVLGAGLDLGVEYPFQKNGYFGFLINNIGITFAKSAWLPLQVKFGGAFVLDYFGKDHIIVPAADLVLPFDSNIKLNAGVEYAFQNTLFLRVGYKMGYSLENFAAGAGFRLTLDRTQYEINYSYTPGLENIGTSHRVSLIVRLGLPLPSEIVETPKEELIEETPVRNDIVTESAPPAIKTSTPSYPTTPTVGPTQRRR